MYTYQPPNNPYVEVRSMFTLDDIDRRLLGELLKDSKRSYRELAKAIGVSTATVINHVQRLESAGVVKDYTVSLDHERLGYELTVITEIIVSKGKLLETEEAIGKIPNVCAVYDITGETDAMVIAKFRSRSSLSDFTKKLLSMPFVERTNTHVVLTTMKEDFRMASDI
jgi:DNA-binding Lrp family transcriptional regulator